MATSFGTSNAELQISLQDGRVLLTSGKVQFTYVPSLLIPFARVIPK